MKTYIIVVLTKVSRRVLTANQTHAVLSDDVKVKVE